MQELGAITSRLPNLRNSKSTTSQTSAHSRAASATCGKDILRQSDLARNEKPLNPVAPGSALRFRDLSMAIRGLQGSQSQGFHATRCQVPLYLDHFMVLTWCRRVSHTWPFSCIRACQAKALRFTDETPRDKLVPSSLRSIF